jgi:hypothetical protein
LQIHYEHSLSRGVYYYASVSGCAARKIIGAQKVFFIVKRVVAITLTEGVVARGYHVRARLKESGNVRTRYALYVSGVLAVHNGQVNAEVFYFFSQILLQKANGIRADHVANCQYPHFNAFQVFW